MASSATIILTGVVYLSHVQQGQPVLKAAITQSHADMVSTRGGVIPRHRGFVSVRASDVDAAATNRIPDVRFTAPGKAERLIYFLRNESLALSGYSDTKLEIPSTVTGADRTPFANVLKLDNFCPTCRPLDFAKPNLDYVGGRLDIAAGTVVARALSPCSPWHFDPEPGFEKGHSQAITPREVAVTLSVPAGQQLKLRTEPLSGAPGTSTAVAFKAGIDVDVTIGSATVEDILEIGGPAHGPDKVDHHFELFYFLLLRSNAARHPLPVGDAACVRLHRPSGADCPPVQQ